MGRRQNSFNKFVFVYGNQMKSFGGNALLKGCKFMGEYTTKRGDYAIASMYGRACAFEAADGIGAPIVGELYKIDYDTSLVLDQKNKVKNVSDRVQIKLKGFGKRVSMYILDKAPVLPEAASEKAFIIDKHAGLVYNWKEHCAKLYSYPPSSTPSQPTTTVTENKPVMPVVTQPTQPINVNTKPVEVPTVYDPQVKMKDGTVVSRATLAWEILSIVDDMEYIMDSTNKMADIERGKKINACIEQVKGVGKKVMAF